MTEYAPDDEEPIQRHAAGVSDSNTRADTDERPPQPDQAVPRRQEDEQASSS